MTTTASPAAIQRSACGTRSASSALPLAATVCSGTYAAVGSRHLRAPRDASLPGSIM
ncbi:hypothetical protein [Streptomyces sp. NPDC054784]